MIESTSILQEAITSLKSPPPLWINSSSATIYTHSETHLNTEEDGVIGDDFSMNVCKKWETVFFQDYSPFTRKVALRTSIVLSNEGGAFPKLKQITRLGLGGYQGDGYQLVSWIHGEDFCRAIEYIIKKEKLAGPINVTSPNPIANKLLMKYLRKSLGMPIGINQHKALLELGAVLMRTETELLLKSRNVYPECLLNSGFEFKYENIEIALENMI